MVAIDLQSMVGWLNPTCKKTLEASVGLTMSRTHFNAEIEHWLLALLAEKDTDIEAILRHYDMDRDRLVSDLNRVLDRFKTGNSRPPALSPRPAGSRCMDGDGRPRSAHRPRHSRHSRAETRRASRPYAPL